jgi:hypothetical protein
VPTRITVAKQPNVLAVENGALFYNDQTTVGIMKYVPGGTPSLFRAYRGTRNLFVDGPDVFFTVTYSPASPPQYAYVYRIHPDTDDSEQQFVYSTPTATAGRLRGSPTALYFTAYDWRNATGGVVRRIPRAGSATTPCSYGGAENKRPDGLHIDTTKIYWTNQGEWASPYAGGSVASCPLAGCCTAAEVETLWTGDGEPGAITADDKALYWVTFRKGGIWKLAK